MSFPNTISSTAQGGVAGFPGAILAPNGALYVAQVLPGFSNSVLQVLKSIDGGATWLVQDDAHDPMTFGDRMAMTAHGAVLYVVSNDTTGAFIQVSSYNTATDLWVTTTVTANAAIGPRVPNVFFRTGDSKLAICGCVSTFAVTGQRRTAYCIFDTGALTVSAWTACGGTIADGLDWECDAILLGSAEVDFLFWSYATGGAPGGTRTIYRQPLSNLGVLGSLATIDSVTDVGFSQVTPQGFSDGITATAIWSPTSQSPLAAKVYKAPVSTWVFAAQTLTAAGTESQIYDTAVVNSAAAGVVAFIATQNVAVGTTGEFWFAADTGSGFGPLILIGSILLWNPRQDALWANLFPVLGFGLAMQNNPGEGPSTTYFWLQALAPPPVPANVDPDPAGAFELLRITATMRPARHLPVRGSSQ